MCKWLASNDHKMALLCQNGTYSISKRYHQTCKCLRFPLHWDQRIYIWLPNLWSKHRAVLRIPIKFITLDTMQINGMTLHRLIKMTQACAQISVYEANKMQKFFFNFYYYYQFSIFIIKCVSKVCLQTACLDLNSRMMFDILMLSQFTGIVFQASWHNLHSPVFK